MTNLCVCCVLLAYDLSWSLGRFYLHCPSNWGKHINEGKEYSWLLAVACAIDLGLPQAEEGALQGRTQCSLCLDVKHLACERLHRNGVSQTKEKTDFFAFLKAALAQPHCRLNVS